jgi:lipid A 4'-phosphatase
LGYLRLKRGQIVLACFLLSSLLLLKFPAIDIYISTMFFDTTFYLGEQRWQRWFRDGLVYFLSLSMLSVVGIYFFNRLLKRNVWRVDGKKICFLFLVLILGAGLIVNVIFKDNFGRARPRDIHEFGGSKQFTPAFIVSTQCYTNCSFSSGEGAGGFFSLALALALTRKRACFVGGLALGSLVSFSRIASGAHFFSDTIVSFFVMLIITDVLYYYILTETEQDKPLVPVRLHTQVIPLLDADAKLQGSDFPRGRGVIAESRRFESS